MKHTTKQPGRSRNKALAQRAAQLGCGISLLAVSAMLAARPAHAGPAPTPDPASVLLTGVPADSGSAGFVTAGSQQVNTAAAVSAAVNDAFGASTVDNTATGSLPSTESVTGNELAAFATGSGQTNTVDFDNIGTSDDITGISVLAEQQNTYSFALAGYLGAGDTDPYYDYAPTTIDSAVTDSGFENETTNPVDGDMLNNSSNLIESEVNGNVADSSVIGIVPLNYGSAEPGTISLTGDGNGGIASGNVVVGSSQANVAIDGDDGSNAGAFQDTISLNAVSSGDYPQTDTLSTEENDNAISSVFVGNSANNDIGVDLTSGGNSGGPSFAGALIVANQQAGYQGGYGNASLDGPGFAGNGAYSVFSFIATNIGGDPTPTITLLDGAVTEDDNVISSSATGNSAVSAAGGPGNEISLGVDLAGTTPAFDAGNTINAEGTILSGGDLVLGNQQYQGGSQIGAYTEADIGVNVENLVGSTVNLSNNALTSSAIANNASNAIETPDAAGINLISGLAALTSQQTEDSGAYAKTAYGGIGVYAGYGGGTLSVTNSTANLANDKITTTAYGNQVANSVALSASTIDAGAAGAATGPATVGGELPGADVADAGLSLNNLQISPGYAVAVQYGQDVSAYIQGETLSNDSAIVTNPLFTSEAAGNSATNSITADGAQGVSGSVGLLSSQVQLGGADAYLTAGEDGHGNFADIVLQSLGGDGGISGSTALLSGSESYAEATDNSATNTLDAMGGTLSNAAGAAGTLGLGAQFGVLSDVGAQAVSDLALVNEQDDFAEPAYADNYNSEDNIFADATDATISDSTFTVSGPAGNAPAAQALAIGNEALNALSALASTVLTDTAGLVNAQSNLVGAAANLEDNYVDVLLNSAFESYQSDYDDDGGDIDDTSITVGTGAVGGSNPNILRALAYGNQASNVLSVSAGEVNPDATANSFTVDGSLVYNSVPSDNVIGAAYDLLSDQASGGVISAEDEYTQLGIYMGNTITNPALTDVTASTAGNAVVASAFGNQASNSATVAANNLLADEYLPLADVTNQQTNEGTLSATLSEDDDIDYPLLTTQLAGDGTVQYSSLGVTDNTVLTQAEGNDATNSLDTTTGGNNITDAALTTLGEVEGSTFDEGNSSDPLAFSEQNDQYQDGPITVDQAGANALVATGGDVAYSTFTADTNAFEATGYGNNATNSLDFGGTNSPVDLLDTSAGLQNTQFTESDLNVTLGAPEVPATLGDPAVDVPAVPYTVADNGANVNRAYITNTNTLTVEGQPLVFNVTDLTGTELTDFEDALPGGDLVGDGYTLTAGNYTVENLAVIPGNLLDDSLYQTNGSPVTEQAVAAFDIPATGGTPAEPSSPSVLITIAGDIFDSTLDVSGNTFNATAIANNAVNTQNIAATSVGGGADITGSPGAEVDDEDSFANADYALVNNQSFDATVTATAYGEAGINPTNASSVLASTLNVSDNSLLAEAEAEVASNTLSLSATNSTVTPPTFALVNNQGSEGDVTATSGTIGDGISFGLVVTAPGAINSSTLTMDDNSSEALAVDNNATNLLSADVTNLADESGFEDAVAYFYPYTGGDVYADPEADYTLTNVQTIYDGTVSATDVTEVENSDATSITTAGLLDSAAELNGNTTAAFAEANAANNTLDMTSSNSAATGALTNGQSSGATVEAEGAGFVGFALNGGADDGPPAAAASSISVANNSTTVQGIGNQATNALNADTGSTYGPQGVATTSETGGEASATYAVLNYQQNTGNVSASGTAYYGSELAGAGTDVPVGATTVTVSYNTVDVKAFGNSATNSATVSALNSGNATVALENTQTNSGAITATADDSEIGSQIGAPGGSNVSVAVGNNSIVASAIGNVATNAIASH